MSTPANLRPSSIAGQWYPADPKRLASSVDAYIQAARLPELQGEIIGVLAPHAGHRYSGPVAGHAFAALRGSQADLAVVVSPMHHMAAAELLTTAHAAYETPLGAVPVDEAALDELNRLLQAEVGFGLVRVTRDPEHSLEIELPFLQRVLPQGFRLLPVMVRDPDPSVARALGLALAKILRGRQAVLVASSDLSHFYPQSIASKLDGEMLRRVAALDPLAVLRAEDQGVGFACGRAALAAVLWGSINLGADRAVILNYATSGDITQDFSQVVGYAAAAFIKTG